MVSAVTGGFVSQISAPRVNAVMNPRLRAMQQLAESRLPTRDLPHLLANGSQIAQSFQQK